MTDLTGRQDFAESWLTEMPTGLGNFETWEQIDYSIKDRIKHGSKVIHVTNNLCKIEGKQTIYYWYGDAENIILGAEFYIKPQTLVVTVVGKNKKYQGNPPYASDLYAAVLKDYQSIRIMSDNSLSDEGFTLWKRLLSLGHSISVYDAAAPGKTFASINNPEEMDKYFAHDNTDFKRYQFILTENKEMLAETRSLFNIRRYRELIPGLL